MQHPKIIVAGAGSVGCLIGGLLAAAGRDVTLFGRARILDQIAAHGLIVSDNEGLSLTVPKPALTQDASALAEADLILVTVKSGATEEMGQLIHTHAKTEAIVVSLQNGVSNARVLREAAPKTQVPAGMVPFNVMTLGEGRFLKGTSGDLVVEAPDEGVVEALAAPGLTVRAEPDMQGVLWGKLVVNLNNALNALCGLPLKDELEHREWRRLLSEMQKEALAALSAVGIKPLAAVPMPLGPMPYLLRLPTPMFKLVAGQTLKIAPMARSSMWEDLEQRRPTEIDELQGAVVALAEQAGLSAPLCERVALAVKDAEQAGEGSPFLVPEDLLG